MESLAIRKRVQQGKENNHAPNKRVLLATTTSVIEDSDCNKMQVDNALNRLAKIATECTETAGDDKDSHSKSMEVPVQDSVMQETTDIENHFDTVDITNKQSLVSDSNNGMNNDEVPLEITNLANDYIEHCETIGLSDSLITRAEKVRRITRRYGWKDFKLLNDSDFNHTSDFAECLIDHFGWSNLEEDVIAYKWSQVKKDVYQAMQVARSSVTQALKKAFLGKINNILLLQQVLQY